MRYVLIVRHCAGDLHAGTRFKTVGQLLGALGIAISPNDTTSTISIPQVVSLSEPLPTMHKIIRGFFLRHVEVDNTGNDVSQSNRAVDMDLLSGGVFYFQGLQIPQFGFDCVVYYPAKLLLLVECKYSAASSNTKQTVSQMKDKLKAAVKAIANWLPSMSRGCWQYSATTACVVLCCVVLCTDRCLVDAALADITSLWGLDIKRSDKLTTEHKSM
jgi:hypothetical protein